MICEDTSPYAPMLLLESFSTWNIMKYNIPRIDFTCLPIGEGPIYYFQYWRRQALLLYIWMVTHFMSLLNDTDSCNAPRFIGMIPRDILNKARPVVCIRVSLELSIPIIWLFILPDTPCVKQGWDSNTYSFQLLNVSLVLYSCSS